MADVLAASYPILMARAYAPEVLGRALPLITRPHPRLLRSGRYYLAVEQGAVLGCGGWSFERPGQVEAEAGLAHIRHFAVRPEATGRGVGRALYEHCESEARAAGAVRFEAYSSLNGEPFYLAMGFVQIAPIEVPMGAPGVTLPSILMRREI